MSNVDQNQKKTMEVNELYIHQYQFKLNHSFLLEIISIDACYFFLSHYQSFPFRCKATAKTLNE